MVAIGDLSADQRQAVRAFLTAFQNRLGSLATGVEALTELDRTYKEVSGILSTLELNGALPDVPFWLTPAQVRDMMVAIEGLLARFGDHPEVTALYAIRSKRNSG
jgi:hypothetical protein